MSEKIDQPVCELCSGIHSTESHQKMIDRFTEAGKEIKRIAEEEKNGPMPLDIIKIDGRWAQVMAPQISSLDTTAIVWLDDKSGDSIDILDYKLKQYYGCTSGILRPFFSDDEFKNIHWASGETGDYLKSQVNVFGEYEKADK